MSLKSLTTAFAVFAVAAAPASDLWARGGGGGRGGGGVNGGYRGGNQTAGNNAGASRQGATQGNFANRNFSSPGGARGPNAGTNANGSHPNSNFFGNNGAFAGNRYAAGYRGMGPGGGFANNGFNRFGYGQNGLGYGIGGLGYGGYGMGGVGLLGMGMMMGGMMGGGMMGGGMGGGGGYGSGSSAYGGTGSGVITSPNTTTAAPNTFTQTTPATNDGTVDHLAKGEADFKAGQYQQAIADWKHGLIDEPQQAGALGLMIGQALFAQGQFEPAAGIIQAGMNHLPESQWGGVVSNHAQLYGSPQDFTNQLKALETARTATPDSPALRFLLGYEYGYLNYPNEAVKELDKAIQLNPKDPFAATLRNEFGGKIGLAAVVVPKPVEAPVGGDGRPALPASAEPQAPSTNSSLRTTGLGAQSR